MGRSDGSVIIDTRMDTSKFDSDVPNLKKGLGSIGNAAKKLAVTMASVFAVGKLVSFGKESIELGSDLAEVQNVVDVTFEHLNKDVNEFARNSIVQFGLSEKSAKQYSSTLGAMLKSMGFTVDESKDMSIAMTGLAGDIASFYNLSTDEAFAKIRAGISGETEPLKQLGINLSVANLEQYALTQGIKKSYSAMSQQEQALLRYNYLLSVTSDAQGDFARTSDGWANQTRILAENFNSLKATIGQGLINIFTPVIKVLNELIARLQTAAGAFKSFTEMLTGNKSSEQTAGASALSAAMDDVTESTEEAEKAQKGYLSGIDEIKTYSSDDGSDSGSSLNIDPGAQLQNSIESVDAGNLAEVDTIFGRISKQVKKLISQLKKLVGIFNGGLFEGLGDYKGAFSGIVDDVCSIGDALKNIFVSPEVTGAVSRFAESVSYNLGRIVGAIGRIGLTIGQNLVGGAEKYFSENSERVSGFIANMFDFGSQISELAGQLSVSIADVFSVFGSETAQAVTGNIIGILSEIFMGTTEFVGEGALEIVNRIVETFEENRERLKETMMSAFKGFEDATSAIKDSVGYVSGTVLPDLNEAFSKALDLLEPFKDFLVDTFFSAWNDVINPALGKVGDAVRQVTSVFKNLWENVLVPLGKLIGDILSPIIDWLAFLLNNLWQNVIKPLAQFVTETFFAAWEAVCTLWDNVLLPIISKIVDAMQFLWDKVGKPLVEWFKTNIYPVVQQIFDGIRIVINGFKENMKSILSFFTSVFKGDWASAWESVKNIFKNTFDSLVTIAKTPINLIIGMINALVQGCVDGMNAIITAANKISWKVPDWVPAIGGQTFGFDLKTLTAPTIPYLAKGAVIPPNAPFAAVLGDQRHGTNIEAPLDTIKDAVRNVLAERGSGQGFNGTIRIPVILDGRQIYEAVVTQAELAGGRSGRVAFDFG